MWRDLGMSLQLYQSHSFATLILILKFSLNYQEHIPRLTRKKEADKVSIYKFDHSILS